MKVVLLTLLVSSMSWAAVPNRQSPSQESLVKALGAPLKIARKEIFQMGPQAYKKLYEMSFDQSQPVNTRWKSFMVMTSIGGKKSLPEIERALKHKTWFMRSAGLLSLEKVSQKSALRWARYLLDKDPALMVRAKAVDVLRNNPDNKTREFIWKKMYTQENFHRKQGLWIREHMAQFLADYPSKKDRKRWKKILHKENSKLQASAIQALESITGKKKSGSFQDKLDFWKSHSL